MAALTNFMENLKLNNDDDINILLLGETGVGKSTFINSIANYLYFDNYKKAEKASQPLILIPSRLTITDKNYKTHEIKIGNDKNEIQNIGDSATQNVKTYVFPIGKNGKTRLRFIDTPGMGDVRGVEQDDKNCENILSYITQLKQLHAICFLMTPTVSRRTATFEYCIKQILSRLDKSAANNIIFTFTNTRSSNYSPGETLSTLRTVIDDINKKQNIQIPYSYEPNNSRGNIYCVDNEAFRILVATKFGNIKFDDSTKAPFIESWKISTNECWRLISHILGDSSHDPLPPHQMKNTACINEARRLITQLAQPLAEITQLIGDNIRILERHKQHLGFENQSLEELKKKLYMPIINLQVTKLTQPVTVCTAGKCSDPYKVGGLTKWHYRQRCHDPCYLTNVQNEVIGDPGLAGCASMSGRNCIKCTCDFSIHMHVYYMTKTVEQNIEDQIVKKNINDKRKALQEAEKIIDGIDQRKKELEDEKEIIIKSTAQFAHFLQNNAITPYNDAYEKYIVYLIDREKSLGNSSDYGMIAHLEKLVRQYREIKEAFNKSLHLQKSLGTELIPDFVTPNSIMQTIEKLYKLKHNGKKIKELYKTQKISREREYESSCEYIHPKTSKPNLNDKKDSDKDQKEKKNPKQEYQKYSKVYYSSKGPKGQDGDQKGGRKWQQNQGGPQRGQRQQQRGGGEQPPPYGGYQNYYPSRNDPPPFRDNPSKANPSRVELNIKLDRPEPSLSVKVDPRPYSNNPYYNQAGNAEGYTQFPSGGGPPDYGRGPEYRGNYPGGPPPAYSPAPDGRQYWHTPERSSHGPGYGPDRQGYDYYRQESYGPGAHGQGYGPGAHGQGYGPGGHGQGYGPGGHGQGYGPGGHGQGYGPGGHGQGYGPGGHGQGYGSSGHEQGFAPDRQGQGFGPREQGPGYDRPDGQGKGQRQGQRRNNRGNQSDQGGNYKKHRGKGRNHSRGRVFKNKHHSKGPKQSKTSASSTSDSDSD